MTPAEKARELVDSFHGFVDSTPTPSLGMSAEDAGGMNAKSCALTAIDWILDALEKHDSATPHWVYWDEVKREIEKL